MRCITSGNQNLLYAARIEDMFGVRPITRVHYVLQTQFKRVHAQTLGAKVEMGFGRELRLQ